LKGLIGIILSAISVAMGDLAVEAAEGTISTARTLGWGADAEGGAAVHLQRSGRPTENIGYEKDLADALAAELGRPIEFMQYQFQQSGTRTERKDFGFSR